MTTKNCVHKDDYCDCNYPLEQPTPPTWLPLPRPQALLWHVWTKEMEYAIKKSLVSLKPLKRSMLLSLSRDSLLVNFRP